MMKRNTKQNYIQRSIRKKKKYGIRTKKRGKGKRDDNEGNMRQPGN